MMKVAINSTGKEVFMSGYQQISEKCKKYWGVIPLILFLAGKTAVVLIEVFTDSALRSVPQMILSWFGGISVGILIFWIGKRMLWKKREKVSAAIRVLRAILCMIYCVVVAAAVCIGFVINVFAYHPEHVVEKNGMPMVASVSSFLQETVTYYDYKNVLFRGREAIGWEDYGNGGGDPFEQGIEPGSSYFRDIDINSER